MIDDQFKEFVVDELASIQDQLSELPKILERFLYKMSDITSAVNDLTAVVTNVTAEVSTLEGQVATLTAANAAAAQPDPAVTKAISDIEAQVGVLKGVLPPAPPAPPTPNAPDLTGGGSSSGPAGPTGPVASAKRKK